MTAMTATIEQLNPRQDGLKSSTPIPALLLQCLKQFHTIDSAAIQQLSSFVPVLLLVPESLAQHIPTSEPAITPASRSTEARIRAPHDKAPGSNSAPQAQAVFGEIALNFSEMTALRRGQPVELTVMELKTARYFFSNPRRVISREELLEKVWGYTHYPSTRTVDNHISRLRQKLESDPSRPTHFLTVHGAGYKFLP